MHYLYSSIISRKFIINFLNKSYLNKSILPLFLENLSWIFFNIPLYCICLKSFNLFLSFLQIIVIKRQIDKKLHSNDC